MNDTNGWVLLLWESGERLFGVFGPFPTREKAMQVAGKEPEMKSQVVQLFKPNQVGKE